MNKCPLTNHFKGHLVITTTTKIIYVLIHDWSEEILKGIFTGKLGRNRDREAESETDKEEEIKKKRREIWGEREEENKYIATVIIQELRKAKKMIHKCKEFILIAC